MKRLIDFWKQDIINKLIVLVLIALAGMVLVFGWLFIHLPEGNSLAQAFSDMLPQKATPGFDLNTFLTQSANTPAPPTSTEFLIPSPTASLLPPTATMELPSPTEQSIPIIPSASDTAAPLPAPSQSAADDIACIPDNPHQTGRVVEVLDGNTVRVLFSDDGLVHVIRYLGVVAPTNNIYAASAEQKNTELVYGKQIIFIPDEIDKDPNGRLLRYVLVDDSFINLELIRLGLGGAAETPADFACAQAFQQAAAAARTGLIGSWFLTATPELPVI